LDEEALLPILQENEFVFVIEEHAKNSGLGSILLNFLFEKEIFDKKVYNFGFPDQFYAHGSYNDLLDEAGLSENKIFEKMLLVIQKNGI